MIDFSTLHQDIIKYAQKHGGKIYSPIMHPLLADIPSQFGHERFEIMKPYIPSGAKSLLDIGSHGGYFAHRFEDCGLTVTAVENNKNYLYFLKSIRELCDKKFSIIDKSIFDMDNFNFDIVLALNIFHHFLKKKELYIQFKDFLNKLNCNILFFQAHNPNEGQMRDAYINYAPEDFAGFIKVCLKMKTCEIIGETGTRNIYMLKK